MRRQKVKLRQRGRVEYSINGYFHCWGNIDMFGEMNDLHSIMRGFVELEDDGTIKAFPPEDIQFVDSF